MKSISIKTRCCYFLILVFSCLQLNAQSPLDKRIDELVDAMTTQEKINQLINTSTFGTPSNVRLGIPGFAMEDGPHGVRFAGTPLNGRSATAFPTGVAMAATFDQDISIKVGEAMGLEFWAFNRNTQLGPCIDICRDPRGGRSAESGGEDAYLAGHIGKSVAIGIQRTPIIATVKHYMGESKQVNRYNMDVLVTDRWLMDFAGYNFRTVIQDAGVLSVMGAYNKVNGDKACESFSLLTTNLRERWGYPFYVVSDWNAIFDSSKALKAGTDICMGSTKYATDLPGMVTSGAVSIADLDLAVKRILKTKILDGMLDYFPYGNESYAKTAEIHAINRLAADKSIILLKNSNTVAGNAILPLKKTGIKIALIGPNAIGENLNCYGSSATVPSYAISVKEGIEAIVGADNVQYVKGCDINSTDVTGFDAAKTAASTADVVIFAGGLDATQEGEGYNTGVDRKSGSIALPGQQQTLINQLAAVNPNLVAVIQSGGVCGLNACLTNIKGLVYSFYAAQEAGTAIADVLFGDYNPAGRMPMSMVKKDADLPSWAEETFRRFTENLDGGYRWLDEKGITPDFAFGFGLSYTNYSYSNLVVSDATVAGQPITVSVDVQNTGTIAGEEVAQLYLSCPSSTDVWMPKKQLRGFKRIALQAGETKTVTFQLNADDFYYWNGTQYVAQSGNFTFRVGGSSDNLPLTKVVNLTNGEAKPDLKITQIYTMPRYPLAGQQVSFYALVKNQGNAANTSATAFKIDYKIDGVKVAGSENITTAIAPGQVQLIASTGVWTSDKVGKPTLSGELTFNAGATTEWDATNNNFSRNYEVFNPELNNLAYLKPVTTSSVYGTNVAVGLVDGDMISRWESARTDNEYVSIDLQGIAALSNISIYWEAAFAKSYKIECSLNGTDWSLLQNITSGIGGVESYAVNSVQARYIKITCLERTTINATKYGFSIYEVVVNGTLQKFPDVQVAPVESKLYLPYAKTILNGSGSGGAIDKEKLTYQWSLVSGPTDAVIVDPTSALTVVKFKTVGTYVLKLTGTNSSGNASSAQVSIQVVAASATSDLAFKKPSTSSGNESSTTGASMAVDGDGATRWSSAFSDNQWWQVDLQHQIVPTTIKILWEAAYAKNYNIEISVDGKTWQTYYTNTAATGGANTITNTGLLSGRYLKVNCVQRATTYGNSFYTFNLSGAFINSTNQVPFANAGSAIVSTGDCTLNGTSTTDGDNDPLIYKWEQLAGPSTATFTDPASTLTQISNLREGEYYFKLNVDDGKDIDFDVVKVTINTATSGFNELESGIVLIYPNPATNRVYISGDVAKVSFYSLQGQLVQTIFNANTVDVSTFAKGLYLVYITTKQAAVFTHSLIIV